MVSLLVFAAPFGKETHAGFLPESVHGRALCEEVLRWAQRFFNVFLSKGYVVAVRGVFCIRSKDICSAI